MQRQYRCKRHQVCRLLRCFSFWDHELGLAKLVANKGHGVSRKRSWCAPMPCQKRCFTKHVLGLQDLKCRPHAELAHMALRVFIRLQQARALRA